jgi:hypothetical protein
MAPSARGYVATRRCELVELATRVPVGLSTERLQFFGADKDGGKITGNSVAVFV